MKKTILKIIISVVIIISLACLYISNNSTTLYVGISSVEKQRVSNSVKKQWIKQLDSLEKVAIDNNIVINETKGSNVNSGCFNNFILRRDNVNVSIYLERYNCLTIDNEHYFIDPFNEFCDLCNKLTLEKTRYELYYKADTLVKKYHCIWYQYNVSKFDFAVLDGDINTNLIFSAFDDKCSIDCSLSQFYQSQDEVIYVIKTEKFTYRIKKIYCSDNVFLFDVKDGDNSISCELLYNKIHDNINEE